MEVMICVPLDTDISVLKREFPDIEYDHGYDDHDRYFVGRSLDERRERGEREWLSYSEAVKCCGFTEGAIPDAEVLIEGNGGWAQSMISRMDFTSFAVDESTKRAWKRTSNRYWRAYKRGKRCADLAKAPCEKTH